MVLTAVAGLAVAACGSGSAPTASYQIETPTSALSPGETAQFSVTKKASVLWGLEASGNAVQATGTPVYPLKVSTDGRYLVDQADQPWRVQADAAWLMSSDATPDEVDQYLATRQGQGFNAFYLMAMVHPGGYGAAPNAPNNWQGDPPFATPGDFSTAGASPASEQYWAWIDSIIDKAAARHMVVMLAYTYLGWNGSAQGWYQDVLAQPNRQALFNWGEWLGNRYKDKSNIIWFGLGDYAPEAGEGSLRAVAIAQGIKAAGAQQLFMAESNAPDALPSEAPDFGAVVDMNSFYGFGPDGLGAVYLTADRARKVTPPMPAWMEEGTYEFENNWGHFSAQPWDTRRGRFWSVLGGATAGDGFGSRDVWQWQNIPASLSSDGATYSSAAFALFATMPWWELEPSGTGAGFAGVNLVTDGVGTWGQLDYITSAVTSDHGWLLAYAPVTDQDTRTFSVDMAALAGPARARWFDPATGDYVAISNGYEYPNSGTRQFTTPGSRDDGTDDWLLVVDSEGGAPCGSINAQGQYTAPAAIPQGVSCQITAVLASDPAVRVRAPLNFTQG